MLEALAVDRTDADCGIHGLIAVLFIYHMSPRHRISKQADL
jgi:hypothetical protein